MFNRRKSEDEKPVETTPGEATSEFRNPGAGMATSGLPEDNGLDVPPFRPIPPDFGQMPQAFSKETPMARSPFSPAIPPSPNAVLRPSVAGLQSPNETPLHDGAERRTLVVGRGISVQGTVQDAERLVVEGTVEAVMINGLAELAIAHGGVFKGEVEVNDAEVAGTIDGTLTARNALVIRSTGRVLGTARCRRLQVEDGGQMTGRIEMLGESAGVGAPVPALQTE
jgi:cytoskeletal protein CcmA (bactofilin family)